MTKLFSVYYRGFSASDTDMLRVSRKWGLPGVKCPVCRETWATTGIAYPSVDLSTLPGEKQYRQQWPVSLVELDERRRPLLDLIPNGSLPPPGTELGPLLGTGEGTFAAFVWLNPWILLAHPDALDQLKADGVKLPKSVPALITFKKANVLELLELELEPRSTIDPSSFQPSDLEPCPACGRVGATLPSEIVIKGSSIPCDVDIFRDQIITTLILATYRFVEAVNRLKLKGLEFQEVEIK